MARIATCPKCAKQLGLPESIEATDRAECPECRALFSLSEAIQIALPVARIIDFNESVPTTSETTKREAVQRSPNIVRKASSKETPAGMESQERVEPASDAAPIKSWEERLKKALALDDSDDEQSPAREELSEASEAAPKESSPSSPPSFEIDLDLDPPKQTESPKPSLNLGYPGTAVGKETKQASQTTERSPAGQVTEQIGKKSSGGTKTLGDFATSATKRAAAKVTDATSSTVESVSNVAQTLSDNAARRVKTQLSALPQVAEQAVQSRRNARSGFPKFAAFAIGPVVGSLLGLYGLLLWQGKKADYVGLSNVLPEALLPGEREGEIASAVPAAEGNAPEVEEAQGAKKSGIENPIIRDGEVQTASAEQPVPTISPQVRVSAQQFITLVDEASAAVPDFVAGDLTTPESVRRKGQAYMKLCALAEQFDFAKQLGLAPPLQTKATQAEQLFEQLTGSAQVREELAHIASRWWEYEKRPNFGIFFSGRIHRSQASEAGQLCWIQLSANSPTELVPVWMKQGSFQKGEPVAVVGRVLSDSNDLPRGFSGKQLVGAELVFPL